MPRPSICHELNENGPQSAHSLRYRGSILSANDTNRAVIDAEHLRLLSIFHFVAAGLAFIGVCFAFMYFVFFQAMFANPDLWAEAQQGPPPDQMISLFREFIIAFGTWFLVSAVVNLLSGLFIRSRRHRMFSMVVAGLNCLHVPLGTVLGVFTFFVLGRDSVRQMYESQLASKRAFDSPST